MFFWAFPAFLAALPDVAGGIFVITAATTIMMRAVGEKSFYITRAYVAGVIISHWLARGANER